MLVHAVTRRDVPPVEMPERFRHEIAYFMTPAGAPDVPSLATGEYWVRRADAQRCLDEFCVRIVSPLDTAHHAEIELTDDHERWLEWLLAHDIQHVRLG